MYEADLTIPAKTTRYSPETVTATLNAGRLVRILIGFPPGCAALARVAIYHLEKQIEPWNPLGYFAWDNYVFDIRCDHEISLGAPEITVKGWNLDDSYEHTVHLWFEVVQVPLETTETLLQRLLKAFAGE